MSTRVRQWFLLNQRHGMSSFLLCGGLLLLLAGMASTQPYTKPDTNVGITTTTTTTTLSDLSLVNALRGALRDLREIRPEAYHYSGAKKGYLSAYNYPRYPYGSEISVEDNRLSVFDPEEENGENVSRAKRQAAGDDDVGMVSSGRRVRGFSNEVSSENNSLGNDDPVPGPRAEREDNGRIRNHVAGDDVAPSRRFLFSPSISNTITNLNQNTNTNTNVIHRAPAPAVRIPETTERYPLGKPAYQPVIPYPFFGPNPLANHRKTLVAPDKQFDLRGTGVKKVLPRFSPDILTKQLIENIERLNHHYRQPLVPLNANYVEQARRTLSTLTPEARRFLFSPTIQNTITNLNQNQNSNLQEAGITASPNENADGGQVPFGYVNPQTGATEYDLRGRTRKICFTIE